MPKPVIVESKRRVLAHIDPGDNQSPTVTRGTAYRGPIST